MKTHIFLSVFASLLFLQNANAAVYTCTANGRTVYQGKPCKGTGKTVGQLMMENDAKYREQYKAEQERKKEAQFTASKSESQTMGFNECKNRVLGMQLAAAGLYKTTVIVNAAQNYVARVCTNDGSVLMTCSGLDKKLILVKSDYCP